MTDAPDSTAPPDGGRFTHDLTTGSILRHLVMFSLPMLAGNLLQVAYSFVNAIWVGKFLGTTELAAVTVSFPIFFVLMALAGGLTMATNILVSQYMGAKQWPQVRRVVQSSTLLIGLVSLGLLGVGLVCIPSLLRLMGTSDAVFGMAVGYMRLLLFTMPASFGIFLLASLLRGAGDSTTPLIFQVASVLLNAALDPVLMFGWLGAPKLGLNGTAVATVISALLALVALALYLQRRRHPMAPDWAHLSVDWPTWGQTFRLGLPTMVQQSLISIGMVVVVGIVNRFGDAAVAALGAGGRIDQLAFLPAMTLGMAVSTMAGQNIGARRFDRVQQTFWWGVALSGGLTLLATFVAVTWPRTLLSWFVNDPAVITYGVDYLYIVGSLYLLFAVMFISNGVINGAGHTLVATLISLVSLWAVRVPLAVFLSRHLGVQGVWWAMPAGFAMSMLFSLGYFASGRWKKSAIMPAPPPASEDAAADESDACAIAQNEL